MWVPQFSSTPLVLPPLQNLENEICSHKALSQVVTGTGHKLVQAGHFAAEEVAARVQQLEVALNHLETEAARRRRRLQQALEVQQTSVEVRGMLRDVRTGLRTRECMGLKDASRGRQSCLSLPSVPYFHCFFQTWVCQLQLYVRITWTLPLAITSELPHKLNTYQET